VIDLHVRRERANISQVLRRGHALPRNADTHHCRRDVGCVDKAETIPEARLILVVNVAARIDLDGWVDCGANVGYDGQ